MTAKSGANDTARTSFTPGPWGEDWNAPSNIIAENGSGRFICSVPPGGSHENAANARLIAKAPEMYELLTAVAKRADTLGGLMDRARVLIEEIDG